jgi:hypothetical protein
MTVAQTRARADISRQLNTIIKDMVTDYQASSEVDPASALSYQENITIALSQSKLQGAAVVGIDEDANGNFWAVVQLSKSDVAKEINQAAAAAKLEPAKAAAITAQDRMDKAFAKVNAEEVGVVSQ